MRRRISHRFQEDLRSGTDDPIVAEHRNMDGTPPRKHGNPKGQGCCPFHAFAVEFGSIMSSRGIRESMPPNAERGHFSRARSAGEVKMPKHNIFAYKFAKIYPLYVQKAERKGRTKEEVDKIVCWLTGYDRAGLQQQIEQENDLETFFSQAPAMHPNCSLIKGVVCGVRVESLEDPLMQKVRYLDKLIDELAKGKAMEKILRKSVT